MHHVNRIGYLITEEPFMFEFECKIDWLKFGNLIFI
jgi:hypothetical protein